MRRAKIEKVISDKYFLRSTKQAFSFVMSFDRENNKIFFSLTNHTNQLPIAQEMELDVKKLQLLSVEDLYDDEALRSRVCQRTKHVISN